MARIYIRRDGSGRFRVRGERKAGKVLLKRSVRRNVVPDKVGEAVLQILTEMGNPGDKPGGAQGTVGEARIA